MDQIVCGECGYRFEPDWVVAFEIPKGDEKCRLYEVCYCLVCGQRYVKAN